MGISIGLVGLGSFGSCFAPLFKNHPFVSRIGLCDREPSRLATFAHDPFYQDKLHPRDCYESLDAICEADFDALVIITQPWLHAPQCIQAMERGKDVYSAVPIMSIPHDAEILDWCDKLVTTVRRTGQRYMLGETTYYRPQAMYCRRQARAGAFGAFVYAEGEYMHDVDHDCNLRRVNSGRTASTSGKEWLPIRDRYMRAGVYGGPMHYPTHSVSGPVCVMRAHAVKVNAYGYRNQESDPFFTDVAFSNEMALFAMSNGATVRILEMRETPGIVGQDPETFRVFGTRGAFSENRWFQIKRPDAPITDMANLPTPTTTPLTSAEMFDPLPPEVEMAFKRILHPDADGVAGPGLDFSPQGHGGSHPYLVHEFVSAVAQRRQPAINVWEAVRYMAMGVAAHQSALKHGETVSVPDWGDAPPA
ncbi:MAG: Gfo/Idh/MocA family oxidoreductase [Lentisphaerae bacterium]|nr:Gfo/Idh/MocA family oxidoreductase [Lentisphaerota bacterium]